MHVRNASAERPKYTAALLIVTLAAVPAAAQQTTDGAKPIVQPAATVQHRIDSPSLQELPLINRNFVRLVALAPGVSSDLADSDLTASGVATGIGLGDHLNLSIAGARRSAINWMLDGVSNVDVGSNTTLLVTPSLESIHAIDILTSNYSAEWPRGGGVQVVTKSGTSRFAGSAYEFFRNDALNANWFFRNMAQAWDYWPSDNMEPPRLRYNNFGYTLGGPGLPSRKKLFFFFSEEWRRMSSEPVTTYAPVFNPVWLTDPMHAFYVPPEERDPIAVKLLAAWPAPNWSSDYLFHSRQRSANDTRQEVIRVDYELPSNWVTTGRFTHDVNETFRARDHFAGVNAGAEGRVAGVVGMVRVRKETGPLLPELSYHSSQNAISTTDAKDRRLTKTTLGVEIPELFPENRGDVLPSIVISDIVFPLLNLQPDAAAYRNRSLNGTITLQRGRHAIKTGGLVTFERRSESSDRTTNGKFWFSSPAFFLRGTAATYYEDAFEPSNELHFDRRELFAQDTWTVRPNVTIDLGVRYSLFSPVTDSNNRLAAFSREAYDASKAPSFVAPYRAEPAPGTGVPLNGIYVGGQNSPYGRAVYPRDFNNVQPRVALAWTPAASANTVVRGGYGIYFDQPQVGIFRAPDRSGYLRVWDQWVLVQNAKLSDPRSGEIGRSSMSEASSQLWHVALPSSSFATPRTAHWSVSVQRQLYRHGLIDIAYAGTRGDHLIRPIDVNEPTPQDFLTDVESIASRLRYPGYRSVIVYDTTARSRYHGLLASFRHRSKWASLTLNYTLSRNRTDASNDDDLIDIPQNPGDSDAEFAVARTDRLHVFAAYYVVRLPFFDDGPRSVRKALLGGWQVAGITTIESGPAARVQASGQLYQTSTGYSSIQRNLRPDQVRDPGAGRQTGLRWIDPSAFRVPAPGRYGTAPVAPFRLPGRHQWDLTVSKEIFRARAASLQFRADFINAFNHTQFLDVYTACGYGCGERPSSFGRVTSTRPPREIQLGLRLYW